MAWLRWFATAFAFALALTLLMGRPASAGTFVTLAAGSAAQVVDIPMQPTERLVQIVSDPSIAYVLFLLGLIGIAAEFYHPGTFVPGTVGTIALVLALIAFANLPISWAGILLILFAIGLFVGELHTGVGALAAFALLALLMGSFLLYSSPGTTSPMSGLHVRPEIIALTSAMVTAFFLFVVRATLRARHLAVRTGVSVLLGQIGVATSDLAPTGTVRVASEAWSAESEEGTIRAGEHVKVVGVAGVTLRVTRSESEGEELWNLISPMSS